MYAFKSNLGRYHSVRNAASALSNSNHWHQQVSSSAVRTDSVGKEDPAFGFLSSDPFSEFIEEKQKHEKISPNKSLPIDEREETNIKEGAAPRLTSKLYENRNRAKYNYSPKIGLLKSSVKSEYYEGYSAFTPLSKIHKTFQQKQTIEKWNKFKNADNEKMQKMSQGLLQDDDEEDYLGYFSSEPDIRLKLFNERFDKQKKGNYNKRNLGKVDQNFDVSPKSQISPDEELFGQLSPQKDQYENEPGDEGDEIQRKYEEAKLERRHTPAYYGNQMKRLCKERKLLDALRILEKEMPAVAAKPDHYCYQVLINACGRAGYTKKSFQLYNKMKKRGLQVQPVAYTGLFNACAQSPWPTIDGIARAHKLREQLKEKGYIFNQTISHAMIKAFGRCGDIKTAFLVVDEMLEQGLLVNVETINFMLQACISDQETGFRHALMVWRKMRELRLIPDIYTYNLLVRCVGSCKAGDPTLTTQLLESNSRPSDGVKNDSMKVGKKRKDSEGSMMGTENSDSKLRESNVQLHKCDLDESSVCDPQTKVNQVEVVKRIDILEGNKRVSTTDKFGLLPNLLGKRIIRGSAVGLSSLDQPEDRLALLGGPAGLFAQMIKDRVTPDLKTVTQLLDSLPPDKEVEESLLQSMENIGVAPDTQFCNMLIRKRCFRKDLDSAKDVLDIMQHHSLIPDLITFGCLALGCRYLQSAVELLSDMDAVGFRPNIEVMTSLVKNGIVRENYFYALEMLHEMHNRDISPDDSLVLYLENARTKARETLLKMESGKYDATKEDIKKLENIKLFLLEYKNWLKKSEIQLPDHPWAQYRLSKVNA